MQSTIWFQFCKRLQNLNSQSNYTPPFPAPEAPCWLAGIVYGLVQAIMFVYHVQSQSCVQTSEFFGAQTLNGQLEDSEEQFAEFNKRCIRLE